MTGQSTPELITAVLREAEEPMRGKDILSAIKARGWNSLAYSPYSVMRDALAAMVRRGDVERVEYGLWKLKSE